MVYRKLLISNPGPSGKLTRRRVLDLMFENDHGREHLCSRNQSLVYEDFR